ncbi:hypothetical protein ABT369_55985 [Dactylosporangium sp. NPDC000244]
MLDLNGSMILLECDVLAQRDIEVPENLDPETYRPVQRVMPCLRAAAS